MIVCKTQNDLIFNIIRYKINYIKDDLYLLVGVDVKDKEYPIIFGKYDKLKEILSQIAYTLKDENCNVYTVVDIEFIEKNYINR